VRVYWTHTAIAHLLAIYAHIARDAPIYAQRIIDRLTRRSEPGAAADAAHSRRAAELLG
jgi:hypothetical protein